MAVFPHMPLATDAYLADTTHLNAQEHGAYLLLLIVAWRSHALRLPDDDKLLARYAKVDPRTWARIKSTVMDFWDLRDGYWTQKKQLEVWENVSKRVEVNRANGQRGGRPKMLENNDQGEATGLPNRTQKKASKTKLSYESIEEPKGPLSESGVSDRRRPPQKRFSYPQEFEEAWKVYPTDPIMSKKAAYAAWAKLDAEDRAKLARSIPVFLSYCQKHPEYRAVHMVRYITDRRFDSLADGVPGVQATNAEWQKRLAWARSNGKWSSPEWGPMPGQAGCLVPSDMIDVTDGEGWSEWERAA